MALSKAKTNNQRVQQHKKIVEQLKALRNVSREKRVAEWCTAVTRSMLEQPEKLKGLFYKCNDNQLVGAHRFVLGVQAKCASPSWLELFFPSPRCIATTLASESWATFPAAERNVYSVFPFISYSLFLLRIRCLLWALGTAGLHHLSGPRQRFLITKVHLTTIPMPIRYFMATLYRKGVINVEENSIMNKMYTFQASSKCFTHLREFLYTGVIQGAPSPRFPFFCGFFHN